MRPFASVCINNIHGYSLTEIEEKAHILFRMLEGTHTDEDIIIIYSPNNQWIYMTDPDICYGDDNVKESAEKYSEVFQSPVVAFSLFGEDFMSIAFCDIAKEISDIYVSGLLQWSEDDWDDFGIPEYQTKYPSFLRDFEHPSKETELKRIYNNYDYVFIEDKLEDYLKLLELEIICIDSDIIPVPKGYTLQRINFSNV